MKKITLIIFFILLAVPASASMMWTSADVKPKVTLKYINPYNGSVVMKNYSSTGFTAFEIHRDTRNRHYAYVRAKNTSGMELVLRGLGVGVTKTTGATEALLNQQGNLGAQLDFVGGGMSMIPDAVNMKAKYTLPSGGRCSGSLTITAAGMLDYYGDSVPAVVTVTQTFKDLATMKSTYDDAAFTNSFVPVEASTQRPTADEKSIDVDFGTWKEIDFSAGAKSDQANPTIYVNYADITADGPSNGTMGTLASGKATYKPASGFDGIDVLHYTVSDSEGLVSDPHKVIMTVSEKPDAKEIIRKIEKDSSAIALSFTSLGLGSGVTGSVATGATSGGTLSGNSTIGFSYTPTSGYTGKDEFNYTLTAVDTGWTATGKYVMQVCPIAVDDFKVLERTADNVNISVLANDIARTGDTLQVLSVKQPSAGTASVNLDNTSVNYDLTNGNPATEDSFTYVIKEVTSGKTSSGTVKIKIQ